MDNVSSMKSNPRSIKNSPSWQRLTEKFILDETSWKLFFVVNKILVYLGKIKFTLALIYLAYEIKLMFTMKNFLFSEGFDKIKLIR